MEDAIKKVRKDAELIKKHNLILHVLDVLGKAQLSCEPIGSNTAHLSVTLPSYNNVITMDIVFLQAFRWIKTISVPPWEIKQCTSSGTWCERVRRNLLCSCDKIKLNVGHGLHSPPTPVQQLTCFLKTDCLPVQYVILPRFYFYRWCIHCWLPLCLHSWLGFVALMFGWKITVRPGTVNNNVVPFCLSLFIKLCTASWFWI